MDSVSPTAATAPAPRWATQNTSTTAKIDSMIISMIIGTASMTSALPIGAVVRSSGTPRIASRSKRQVSTARRALWVAPCTVGVSVILGDDIASLMVGLYCDDDPGLAGSTSRAKFFRRAPYG